MQAHCSLELARRLQTLLEGSGTLFRQQDVHEVILPRSCSFPSAFSHFQALPQCVLTNFCPVVCRNLNQDELCLRSLTECGHCVEAHDAVAPVDCQQIIRCCCKHRWVPCTWQTLTHTTSTSPCFPSSTNIPDRMCAPFLIASSLFQTFTAPVSSKCFT